MLLIERLISYFFESFLVIGAGLGFMGIRPKMKNIAFLSVLYTIAIHAVRTFYTINNIPFGTHTFILVPIFIVILKYLGKQNLIHSTIAIFIGIFLTMWGEGIFFAAVKNVYTNSMDIPGTLLLITLLSHSILIIAFLITYIFKITIINFNIFK